MRRTSSRLTAVTLLALLGWTGCSDETVTGPAGPDGAVVPLAGPSAAVVSTDLGDYEVIDLGTLGGSNSWAAALNDDGMIVGRSQRSDRLIHAFVWRVGEPMVDLGTLGNGFSQATDVNNSGVVTGTSVQTGLLLGFIWTEADGMTSIGLPPVASTFASFSWAINESAVLAGAALVSGHMEAITWRDGHFTLKGTLGGLFSQANDINDDDTVVGVASTSGNVNRATLWVPQALPRDLGTLGGNASRGQALNASEQVVGWSTDAQGRMRPFLWVTAMEDLGTLGGDDGSAWDISDAGLIVGDSETSAGVTHATLWADGQIVDLVGPGGAAEESHARGINEDGVIVGYSTLASGVTHATLWRPLGASGPETPEEFLDALESEVDALAGAGELGRGNARALGSKLRASRRSLDRGRANAAANQLGAFINQVEALMRSRRLSEAEAAPLLELAEGAIEAIREGG